MKKITIIFIAILLTQNSFSQTEDEKIFEAKIDSLKALRISGKFEEAKRLCLSYIEKEAKGVKNSIQLRRLYEKQGSYFMATNDLNNAIAAYDKGLKLAVDLPESQQEKDIYYKELLRTRKAEVLARQGSFTEATELFRTSLAYAEKTNDRFMIYNINDYFSNISMSLGDTIACINYLKKALIQSDSLNDPALQISARSRLFSLLFLKDDSKKTLKLLKEARQILAENPKSVSPHILSITDAITAEYFDKKNIVDSAYFFYKRAHATLSSIAPPDYVLNNPVTIGLANNLLKLGKIEEGIELATAYLKYAQKSGFHLSILSGKKSLAKAYEKKGNYKTALKYNIEFHALKDSLNKEKNIAEVTRLQTETQFDREREVTAKQKEVLRAEANTNKTLAGGIGALALLGFGFFYNARRQNKIIAEKNNQLESLNHTKDRIFAIIGHDLRKPAIGFRGISKVINYLLDNKDYDRLQKVGVEVEKDALSLYKLTDNLLSWALMQKDVMPHNPSQVSAAEIAAETMTVFQRVASDKNITLTSKIPADLTVFADPNALATIVRNLTDNALKYTPEGGSVTLNAVESASGVKIIVEDTGIGIANDKINDIFLLQKDKSERGTAGEKGTGIGLHLIHELVKLNQGEVEVESRVGEGTKVVVMLPKRALAA